MVIDSAFQASYLVAFIMGLFSSLHCVGMCGSIIGTLTLSLEPEIRENKSRLLPFVINYNLGRIFSYSIAGMLAGFIGSVLSLPFAEGEAYRVLQIISAIIMTCAGLYIAGWLPSFAYIEKVGSRFWKFLEPFGRKIIPVKKLRHAFLFGMIWGWLPCGLVYTALAVAITSRDIVQSALTMLSFGLGTLPAVVGVGVIGGMISKLARMNRFKQVIGILLIILALFAALPWLNPMRLQHI